MQSKLRVLLSTSLLVMFSFLSVWAQGQTATVLSDKSDYAPRSTAVFTGKGFKPNEDVQLKVKNLNRPCNTVSADSSYLPWTVKADENGAFVTTWTVCDCLGDSLRLKATGQTSGLIAYAYFTDGSITGISVTGTTFCVGQSFTINYTISNAGGSYNNDNSFIAQLSNATGGFGSPTNIGSVNTKSEGPINVTIPAGTPTGTGYRIRVVSTSPVTTGPANSSNLTIVNAPTTANAGADQTGASTCGLSSVTLAGNVPAVGTGVWSIAAGIGGSFGNTSSPTSSFSGTAGNTYTLRWTITSGNCTSTDDVVITFNRNPTVSNAGTDKTIIGTSTTLTANTPTVGSGSWSIINGTGGSFSSTTDPSATFTGTVGTTYTLRWAIANSPCTISTDDVDVTFNPATISTVTTIAGANATYGDANVDLVATVTPSAATGDVQFFVGGSLVGTSSLSSGTATFSYNLTGVNANLYTLTAKYLGSSPYTASESDPETSGKLLITQADATIDVDGYSGVYDGNAHGATGTATGVKGEDLASLLNLGATFTNVPGGTANWTFAGNTNYKPANGSVQIEITQADATPL